MPMIINYSIAIISLYYIIDNIIITQIKFINLRRRFEYAI